jgi:adenylosuccinate synthase
LRAYIVVDLGFGDSGKGLLTDFLVRHLHAGVVVRYNGGAQAGHNVVTPEGYHHTFAQFGSGTFVPGVRTYLSHHVVVHPTALLAEGDILRQKGIPDAFSRLRLSEDALVITPYHQAANRIREKARGQERHGSCGVGVGEAVEHALSHPEDRVLAGDLLHPAALRKKLLRIRKFKYEQVIALLGNSVIDLQIAREFEIFRRDEVIDTWMASIARIRDLGLVASDQVLNQWLHETETVVFEGAQGVLLDAQVGFHPYTTWSCCTPQNALELIGEMNPDSQIFRMGVMRVFAMRHGPGPLPTENDVFTPIITEHNGYGEWQGAVRYGWFDAVLARYALTISGGVDACVLTHVDALGKLEAWKYCLGYEGYPDLGGTSIELDISNGILKGFSAPHVLPLAERLKLTRALLDVKPVLENCNPDDRQVVRKIESLLGQSVNIVSRGPTAEHVQVLGSIPS